MKQFQIAVLYILLLLPYSSSGQDSPSSSLPFYKNALGVRFAVGSALGVGLSYQRAMKNKHRLELDLDGLRVSSAGSYFAVAGIYHWLFSISQNLNWYIGPGASLLISSGGKNNDGYVGIGIGGQAGLEYNLEEALKFPLLVSLDTRPMFNFLGTSSYNFSLFLGLRYMWN